MRIIELEKLDFKSNNGLLPAIIQDNTTGKVLMLVYMNEAALEETLKSGTITFYSSSKQTLLTKGEKSENYLELIEMYMNCDSDALLIKAKPNGSSCKTGSDTCWEEKNQGSFISDLEAIIEDRKNNPSENYYTSNLFKKGINKIAQKVGEEATATIIEAKDNNNKLFLNEAADLFFHYLVLLQAKGFKLNDVEEILKGRNRR